ncbi:MAG: hypothetical protein ACR2QO_02445 [Acidimicrobiales bacterium]
MSTRQITNADAQGLAGGFVVPAGEVWEFDPRQNVDISVDGNIRVEGVLRLRPSSATVVHNIRFVGVDESRFVGGGMNMLDTDVGLWVMGAGRLDIAGAGKTDWTRLAAGAAAGQTSIRLAEQPAGWRVGDEIAIAPTVAPGRNHNEQFDEQTITSISGNTVTLAGPLEFDHPEVNGQWTAEVMNLTRNVRIEGSPTEGPASASNGRAHILIRSSSPQSIHNLQIRYMGPRQGRAGNSAGVSGRYSLHFHHSMNGTQGTLVDGVVVRDSGNSAYVTHASHGITIRDSIAYDGWEDAFWWDPPAGDRRDDDTSNDTHDVIWDRNIVGLLRDDPEFRGYRLAGFTLATGTNLSVTNSVAVGIAGNSTASGFQWPERSNPNNVWTFTNNTSHNNRADGIYAWQNNSDRHVIDGFVGYHNGESGIEHGAYRNAYEYRNIQLFGNREGAILQHSASSGRPVRSDGYTLSFEGVSTDGELVLLEQSLPGARPVLYRNCSFAAVRVNNGGNDDNPGFYDFVDCNLESSDFEFDDVEPGTVIRVQDGNRAYRLDADGSRSLIASFYD